ncbi:carbohydrate kinase family protein [Marinicellulosiphila megalodicopiae]|uniref:carbohydrate kinase family protein n=1 Tax=Marinicellulosiphila megalodicopiae TaxID=2724896 RepID=UPI003BAE163E
MHTILCFGELLIDFLNFNLYQDGEDTLNEFRQYPGGAPANVAAAIGKLGGNARFLGQVGDDKFGRFLINALNDYNVDTQFLYIHPIASTPLAFVFLDEHKERSFEFFRTNTADMVFKQEQIVDDVFNDVSIFHFCSNTLTDDHIFAVTMDAIHKAKSHGCTISFDVNLRFNLWKDKQVDIHKITQALQLADIIKVSKEEADWIFSQGFEIKSWLQTAKIIWQTDGGNDIQIFTNDMQFSLPSQKVTVVDSTAAGDAFSAGLLLAINEFDNLEFSQQTIKDITKFASSCGAVAVQKQGALPSLPTIKDVQSTWVF